MKPQNRSEVIRGEDGDKEDGKADTSSSAKADQCRNEGQHKENGKWDHQNCYITECKENDGRCDKRRKYN